MAKTVLVIDTPSKYCLPINFQPIGELGTTVGRPTE